MPIDYHPHPEESLGQGRVFLAWDDDHCVYFGYWDLAPDGPPTALEESPTSSSAQVVIAWAKERTPVVLIRPELAPGEYQWAGVGDAPERLGPLRPFPSS